MLGLALAGATCRDAVGPRTGAGLGQLAFAPILPSPAALASFGLAIDSVRIVIIRPAADTLADTTVALPPDSTALDLDLHVALLSSPETLSVAIVALAGTMPLFTGTSAIVITSGVGTPAPTPIPVSTYVGPGAGVDSLVVQPAAPFVYLNDSLRFQVAAYQAGVPVTQFYVAWSTSDTSVARINHFGVLRAPGVRTAVRVRARTPGGASDSVTATFVPLPTQLVKITGDGQTSAAGQALPVPLEVEVRAADGLGVGGVAVRFRALAGGGAVGDSVVMTDSTGRARTAVTLGAAPGTHTFEASATGLSGSPVTFTATALAGPPAQLLAVAGDAQLATVATSVPIHPAVVVKDAGGNPVPGVSVTFSVASGGGAVAGGSQTTDPTGTATVGDWTLGTLAGTNTLTASAAGLTRTFTATGVADTASQLVPVAGDLQSAPVGTPVATAPAVRAEDQFGNPVAGASVTFSVTGGGGSVSGATQLTNAAGVATVGTWTLGTTAGSNTLLASLAGVTPVVFTATGIAGSATAIVKLTGDQQSSIVNTAVGTAPRVKLVDPFGNPVSGVGVTFAVTSGGGLVAGASQTTDTGGVATAGGWTLGTGAGPNALTATASGLAATFTATALPDAPAQIAPVAGNGQSVVVNTVLPTAPAVIVRDQFNNPVPGAGVTFTASGNGGVTGGFQTTDSGGVATVGSWRLDSIAGTNTLSATSGSLGTVFTATGLAGAATQLLKVAGDGLTAPVGSLAGPAPTVLVRDQYENAVPGLGVTFAVTGGTGSVSGATPSTNTNGLATVGAWTLDTLAGTNALTASAGVLSAVFTATGVPAVPSRLLKVQGDSQTAVVNTALAVAPAVLLTDRYGNAVAGDTIDFVVLVAGGFVANPSAVTDSGGLAGAGAWTLANFVTQNALRAGVRGAPAVLPVQFTATGIPDAPAQLLRVSVDTQTAIVGQSVSVPPAVQVVDQYFNPVPGVSVSFTLTGSLIGSLTPGAATTDSTGVARVTTWTLAAIVGLNTLDADAPGLAGSPITFSASGVTTTAATIAYGPGGGGNGQSGVVATTLATPYSVDVRDAAGLPVQNVPVAWAVGSGGGSISPPTSLTDVNGIATATRTLGVVAGTQTATASVGGLAGSPVVFTATAAADTPAVIVKRSVDPQTATVGTVVTAPVVAVTDLFDNPISGVVVSFAVTGGGALGATLDTTDAAGLATTGTWTLDTLIGTETVTVTSGSLLPVTFTATATVGTASAVVMLDGNGQAGLAGQPLPLPYRVHVTDAFGNGVGDVTVNWSIGARASGGISPSSGPTNGAGIAAATHTLGNTLGPQSAFAWVTGLPDTVTFTSTALAGTAAFLVKQAGDSQAATVNTPLTSQPTVQVTDSSGAPVFGYSVTWAVTSGGGFLGAPATVTTDTAGIATSPVWTLGTAAGSNGLSATAAGLGGSPETFTATGTAGAATQIVKKDGDNQSATVGTAVATPPSVIVRDTFNNPVPGSIVTFVVTQGGGSATETTDTTDSKGIAVVGSWTLGTIAGPNALRASAGGVQPVTFTATGVAGAPVQLGFIAEPTHSLAGDTIEPAVRVAIQDQFGNTVLPATDVVSLGLGAAPDTAAKLLGTVDVAAVNGVAVFPDLAIDSAGVGYTLGATSPKVAGAESQPFDVGGVIAAFTFDQWQPVAAAVNPVTSLVYVPGLNNGVGVLDPGKSLTMVPGFQTPFAVAVNSVTNLIYVTTLEGVVVMNGRDNVIGPPIVVGPDPKGIAVDEGLDRVFVTVAGDPGKGVPPGLALIDPKDNSVIATIPFPEGALAGIGVAFNPNDRLVYVAIPNVGVGVFDPEAVKFVAAISIVGEGAAGTYGVAVDVRTNLLYATNRAENTVSVIDLSTLKEIQRLPVGPLPEGLGVDADRGAVYVGNSGDSTVSVIDAGKLSVIATLIVGPTPKAAAVNPVTGQFFVPTLADDRLRVVQP